MSNDPPREVRRKKTPSSSLIDYVVTESVGNPFDDELSPKVTIMRLYFEAIDMVLQEIKSRFTDFLNLETLKPLKMLGIRMPKREELVACKAYIETLTKDGNKGRTQISY